MTSWSGCYDSLSETVGMLRASPLTSHIPACAVIYESYRPADAKESREVREAVWCAYMANNPSEGRTFSKVLYESVSGDLFDFRVRKKDCGTERWNAKLCLAVLGARYRVKCTRCKALHRGTNRLRHFAAFGLPELCDECFEVVTPHEDEDRELGLLNFMADAIKKFCTRFPKRLGRDPTTREWQALYRHLVFGERLPRRLLNILWNTKL